SFPSAAPQCISFVWLTLAGLCSVVGQDKQAVLEAAAAMMAVLLQEELCREQLWEQLLWLVHPHQEVQDTSRVTKSLTMFLEALEGVQSVIPKDKLLAVTSAVFYQLSDDTKEHSEADRAELTHCILLLGKEKSFGDAWRCPGQNLSHKPAEWVRVAC
ncbi:hypothetical protein CIB84_016425, partial [Bambusicola thoracicus]